MPGAGSVSILGSVAVKGLKTYIPTVVHCGSVCSDRHTSPWWSVVGQCVITDIHPHGGLLWVSV